MKENKLHNKNEIFLSEWIAGNFTDDEFENFVSEEDFIAYKKLRKGIHLYEKLEEPTDSSFKKVQEKIQNKKKTKVRKLYVNWVTLIAASLVLFIGIYSLLGTNSVVFATAFGEQKTINLPDSSEVILSTKSQIAYNKKSWKTKREATSKGEAFFKVKKGSTFTVNTANSSITVLGTQFNVISRDSYFEVICYQGKVKVINNKNNYILKPGNSVRVINGTIETHFVDQKSPSWILGERNFTSVPLKYVINALENQFDISFDRSLIDESIIFTGSFSSHNLDLALASVFKATGIKYSKTGTKTVVLRKN